MHFLCTLACHGHELASRSKTQVLRTAPRPSSPPPRQMSAAILHCNRPAVGPLCDDDLRPQPVAQNLTQIPSSRPLVRYCSAAETSHNSRVASKTLPAQNVSPCCQIVATTKSHTTEKRWRLCPVIRVSEQRERSLPFETCPLTRFTRQRFHWSGDNPGLH